MLGLFFVVCVAVVVVVFVDVVVAVVAVVAVVVVDVVARAHKVTNHRFLWNRGDGGGGSLAIDAMTNGASPSMSLAQHRASNSIWDKLLRRHRQQQQ